MGGMWADGWVEHGQAVGLLKARHAPGQRHTYLVPPSTSLTEDGYALCSQLTGRGHEQWPSCMRSITVAFVCDERPPCTPERAQPPPLTFGARGSARKSLLTHSQGPPTYKILHGHIAARL